MARKRSKNHIVANANSAAAAMKHHITHQQRHTFTPKINKKKATTKTTLQIPSNNQK
jgi:hypothetical protein